MDEGPSGTTPRAVGLPFVRDRAFFVEERCRVTALATTPDDATLSVTLARVERGVTTRWHRLRGTTERQLLASGHGVVELDGMAPRDVVVIPPGCRQHIRHIGEADPLFQALRTPRFRPAVCGDAE